MGYGKQKFNSDKPKKLGPIKQYAIWLLGRQEYSCKNLEAKFKQKGYESQDIESCMKYLNEYGFVSDERYAENRARIKSRQYGNRRIAMDLMQKGVEKEKVSDALVNLDDEDERAVSVIKKFSGKELSPELQSKIWRFMASRGFGSRSIKIGIESLKCSVE